MFQIHLYEINLTDLKQWINFILNRGIHNKYFKLCICIDHLKVNCIYVC